MPPSNSTNSRHQARWMGMFGSVLLHLALLLIFVLLHVQLLPPDEEDMVEVTFARVVSRTVTRERVRPPAPPPPAAQAQPTPSKSRDLADLPKRKALEWEDPQVLVAQRDKILIDASVDRVGDKAAVNVPTPADGPSRYVTNVEKDAPTAREFEFGDNPLPSATTAADAAGMSAADRLNIEWEPGVIREKMSGALPSYPEGVNESAVIKIRFAVKPDGTVGQMIPATKGNARLESAAMRTLKTWRFNRLEQNVTQAEQWGVISFNFQIR